MKTDELIEALARGPVAVDAGAATRRRHAFIAAGVAVSAAAMLLLLGPRPDLNVAIGQPMFWLKLAVPLGLALPALVALARLARPGEGATAAWTAIGTLLLALEAASLIELSMTPASDRAALVAGRTSLACLLGIVALALPILVAALAFLRRMAPTRPRLAGLAAGLAAGALGAAVYALHCDESTLPFLATWYVIAIAIPAVLAAGIGPRLLRWS